MLDKTIKRVLYKVKKHTSGGNEIRWIRIMEGDIECDGTSQCSITYKDKKTDMSGEEQAKLKVDNFNDAQHLFDLLGFERMSYQENKRSKFVCKLDNVKYLVRFDIWPKIEDVAFVAINAVTAASQTDIDGFINAIKVKEFNINQNTMVDVDNYYREKFGKAAIDFPEITFEFDFINENH